MCVVVELEEDRLDEYRGIALDHLDECNSTIQVEYYCNIKGNTLYGICLSDDIERTWFTNRVSVHSDMALTWENIEDANDFMQDNILPNLGLQVKIEQLNLFHMNM